MFLINKNKKVRLTLRQADFKFVGTQLFDDDTSNNEDQ